MSVLVGLGLVGLGIVIGYVAAMIRHARPNGGEG